jgi:hypothetical protein
MANRSMTAEDFSALLPRLDRFGSDSITVLRSILVDGEEQAAACKRTGMKKQMVSRLVRKAWEKANDVPTGWVKLDTWVPPELEHQIYALLAAARQSCAGSPCRA